MTTSLTPGDLRLFQRKLLAREMHLRRSFAIADSNATEPRVNSAQLERNMHELREIDAALERINSGKYGYCMRCGKPVDRARLLLFPAARFDMRCMENEETEHQQEHEQEHEHRA